ncbi:MAG: NUDIX domain-containing protein [Alphaproteobacteria bacterium]
MSRDRKVEIVEKKAVFQGYFRVDAYRLKHSLHRGGMSSEIRREVFERGHAVSVLPYDPARREVVMVEQFRVGAYAAGSDPWLMEIVAGIIDEGETVEQVARREVKEEAGLDVRDLFPAARYLSSPGGSSESVTHFVAWVDASGAGGVHGLDDEDEDIRVVPMTVPEALALLDGGSLENAQALIALQWLAINENKVRAHWGFEPV